ncbi:MAG: TIGR01777 family oxidoreductase [Bacteroidales bacterium]|nr:TIGR01777 family oxidoreductase [Bacteroidales bacterium]
MDNILITGGTGLIGKHLGKKLKEKGYAVSVLSRNSRHDADIPEYFWDAEKGEVEKEALNRADFIIHLAGAGMGDKRWSESRKKVIVDSRVKTAQLLFEKIQGTQIKPGAFISSSAVGYYGAITTGRIFSETDPPAQDFLGETCRQWEEAADRFEGAGIRTVKIRTGVVLTPRGGVLAKMKVPVLLGLGSATGSGKQYLPWIHLDDLCGIYIRAIKDSNMTGVYNAVAPEHVTNRDFMKILARVLGRPFWFPRVPAVAMKLLFGEMSAMLLEGSRVSSEKIRATGYKFQYSELGKALTDLFG